MPAAAILSGGQSRRMGRTKSLIEIEGVPMAVRVATALRAGGLADIALIGGDRAELAAVDLPIVSDLFPGEGPVGGLLTALAYFAGRDVMLVACDIPFLDAESIGSIVSALESSPADVAVARTNRVEPLCALWRAGTAATVLSAFESGTRAMHRVLDEVATVEVEVDPSVLRNLNRPDDLPTS